MKCSSSESLALRERERESGCWPSLFIVSFVCGDTKTDHCFGTVARFVKFKHELLKIAQAVSKTMLGANRTCCLQNSDFLLMPASEFRVVYVLTARRAASNVSLGFFSFTTMFVLNRNQCNQSGTLLTLLYRFLKTTEAHKRQSSAIGVHQDETIILGCPPWSGVLLLLIG
jgi:hypothetical protein